jgi:alginate O-acetyltransferase complex protein AlgI
LASWREIFRPGRTRDALVALASAVVLGIWQPVGLLVTLALTGLAWLALRHGRQDALPRLPTWLVVTLLVGTLAWFKYVPGAWGAWAGVVPLGLSFTVFRLIGVVLDVNALRLPLAPSRLFAMSLFLPTLPAGPITTVRSFRDAEPAAAADAGPSVSWRILRGLARKFLLADTLYALVIAVWLQRGIARLEPYQCLVLPVLLGLYVYWDFAGYSDVAIGAARLLGYDVPENFDRPYASRSLTEFWRRWHITLSEWIRGRLMMKMAGRRASRSRLHGATLASMALCGIWHGAGLGFLLWGLWHGLGLVGLHVFQDAERRNEALQAYSKRFLGDAVATVLTFVFVTIGWIFFFLAPADAWALIRGALAWRGGSPAALFVPALVASALVLAHLGTDRARAAWLRVPPLARVSAQTVLLGILTYALLLTRGGRQGFFYAQF